MEKELLEEDFSKAQRKYSKSEKGKLAKKRYLESPKGKEAQKRYRASLKGKEATLRINEKKKAKLSFLSKLEKYIKAHPEKSTEECIRTLLKEDSPSA